jgi:hypothetical protein
VHGLAAWSDWRELAKIHFSDAVYPIMHKVMGCLSGLDSLAERQKVRTVVSGSSDRRGG